MNVILYTRVSTDEQADGCSLDMQERYLRAYCDNNKYYIIDIYRENFSAKHPDLKRPEFKKMYDYCKKNRKTVDKILFLRWDRYARNVEFAFTYKRKLYDELGIEINAIENAIDFSTTEWSMMLSMYCGMAHTEDVKISRRTKDGIHGTLLKGKCSGRAPRGYKNVRVSKHECWVEIDQEEAKKIQALFIEVAKGVETPTTIRKRMYPALPDTSFFNILRNRFYTGYVHVPAYHDEPEQYVKGTHEAIIDEKIFDRVQDIINGPRKKQPKLTKAVKPELYLRRFLVCPVCGHSITGAFSTGNGGEYPYYFCNNKHQHLHLRAEKVNDSFVEFISTLTPNDGILELYNEILNDIRGDKARATESKVNKLRQEIAELGTRIHRVQDLFFDGEISKEEKNSATERYKREQNELNNQIQSLSFSDDPQMKEKLTYTVNLIGNIGSFFQTATAEVKIKLLGSIFPGKIEFDGKNYRTTEINQTLDLIFKETNQLRGNKNEDDPKNHPHPHLGCDMGLEPMTPRTTIWCSTN